jgi:hypothetical protein
MDASASNLRRIAMDFVQKLATTILGTLLLVFTVAFVSVPYSLGHAGAGMAAAKTAHHLG